jgi:hypothetical protein
MRYSFRFLCICVIGVMPLTGCSEDGGSGGSAGSGGMAGDGGTAGSGGIGGSDGVCGDGTVEGTEVCGRARPATTIARSPNAAMAFST